MNDYDFGKDYFSILHLNIASLSLHLDEQKTLLANLKIEFDIITLTEIKFQSSNSNIINFDIENYRSFFTPSHTSCGGTMIYVKERYSANLLNEFTKSEEGICYQLLLKLKMEISH